MRYAPIILILIFEYILTILNHTSSWWLAAIEPRIEESGVFHFPKGKYYSLSVFINIIIYSVWSRNLGCYESITMSSSGTYLVKLFLNNPYKILKHYWVG